MADMNAIFSGIEKFLNSKGGQAVVGAAGAGLSARGATNAANADRGQSAAQAKLAALQNMANSQRSRQDAGKVAGFNATNLGDEERFRQRNAILQQILGASGNVNMVHPDAGVAAATPQITGGLRLPNGGLSAEVLAMFGPQATEGALARRRQQISDVSTRTDSDETAKIEAAIQALLNSEEFSPQKKKSGGIGGFLKGAAKIAIPAAIGLATGGWGAAAMGAGSGLLSGASKPRSVYDDYSELG